MKVLGQRMLLEAAAEDTAVVADCRWSGADETTHAIRWNAGVASGSIAIEAADRPDYTGTWHLLETVAFAGTAPKQDVVRVAGAYGAIRHRVAVIVQDGTVTSKIDGTGPA